jgi:predicted nucleic acid-binding Zn ribbon protein
MNTTAEKEKEFSDIELCYKAMGLSFSDNPEQVEKTYRKLKNKYEMAVRSSDPAARVGATEDLKQLEELFTTIKESLIYKDYAREYEKYQALKVEQLAARKQKQQQQPVDKEAHIYCPYCKKQIASKLKVCIYCRGKILTPMEQLAAKAFTTRNLVVLAVVVLVVVAGVVVTLNPQFMK